MSMLTDQISFRLPQYCVRSQPAVYREGEAAGARLVQQGEDVVGVGADVAWGREELIYISALCIS